MKHKATKVATYRDKYFTSCTFEYRGHTYDVTYANGISVCCTPAHIQHSDAQERIDKLIDTPAQKAEPIDWDEIFEMINGGE